MSDYKIGKVVAVSGERIFISLIDYSNSDGTEVGVPANMVVIL